MNLGTLLHATADGACEPERDMQVGDVRFLSRPVELTKISDAVALARMLNTWPGVDDHDPGEFQRSIYLRRYSSSVGGAAHPRWELSPHVMSDLLELKDSSLPDGPLFDVATGFFAPSVKAALDKWLGPRAEHRRYTVVIDDRRASIRLVEQEEDEITVHVDLLSERTVYACATLTGLQRLSEDHVACVENGMARIPGGSKILEYDVFLMDGGPTWLDQRTSRSGWAPFASPETDPPEASALDQLHADRDAGEGEEVEFKEWLPPTGEQGKFRQLLNTVSAFANSRGGRIYIGLDDQGGIQGVDNPLRRQYVETEGPDPERWRDAYARRLKQIVADGITPELRPVLEWIDAAGRTVLRITVPSKAQAPYEIIETRDAYIRRGATSRRASHAEIRGLFHPADSADTAASALGRFAGGSGSRLR
jgi:hypothetical protein